MKQLSAMDSVFVYNESSRTPLHISSVSIYDPPGEGESSVRFKDVLQRYEERLDRSPVFRRKLSRVVFDLDTPYWIEDPDFDLEYHVRHIALPSPGDWRQLCILIARLHSRPLDLGRPPWEAYVIEGLDNINGLPKGSWAVFSKTHHAAIDGSTGSQMGEALHDIEPKPVLSKTIDKWMPESEPGHFSKLGKAYIKLFKTPKQVSALVRHAVKSRSEEVRELLKGAEQDHDLKVRTRFNGNVSPHRVFGGLRMELAQLKAIKNAAGNCTLNDVMLSIVGGTMRHYLSEKGELPDSSLVSLVPISTRTKDNVNAEGGNEASTMNVSLRTDIADPLERARAINEDAVRSKVYAQAIGIERISTVIDSIPTSLMSLGMRVAADTGLQSKAPMPHTTVTNVPGPQFPLYFCGAKVSLAMGLGCLMDGQGLFHTVTSYNGYASLTFVSCRKIMDDPEFYHQCINRSLQEHIDAVDVLATTTRKKESA
ncbi:wax ester/triacylglycerol synthase family O-acyltransferase [Spongiibacter sp. KMU-166]|uniref:diacylglycerol O-acyltransferase n=1 Tax=Spongiibacter thalassae TaxID=2721624 RepID=A0ABX1G9V2_9GAMM|nr:wax ester/triacylglycerol synthase family O-acyltransferase [Spongiibacter thalassae]NKI15928.1 wax ester/triacylglycerol synthase family O-acyltransferase [Spongiibacter thalassae]